MKYQAPFGAADPDDPYVDRNTPGAVTGSRVPAKAIEHPQRELDHLIRFAGLTPADTDQELVRKAIGLLMRPGYRSVKAIQNAPPGSPALGHSYVVGDTPTGDWVGHANEIARWSGTSWVYTAPTPWMHVGLENRTDWRWDHTLGTPAWVQWQATVGDIEQATAGKLVTADQLKAARRPYFIYSSAGAATLPNGVDTKLNSLTSLTASFFSDAGSGFASSAFTCGEDDAGAWVFIAYAALEMATGPSGGNDYRLAIAKNTVTGPFDSTHIPATGTYGSIIIQPFNLVDGDVVDVRAFQNTGTSRNASSAQMFGMRLGGS